ncbi:MAG: MarR family winged helix-turn-helix transcriptional regulator [Xanthobacteraceae bacterium]
MDAQLRRVELTMAQYALLAAIEETPGASGAELARRCFITPQSVNGLIAGLLESRLIERAPSSTHGRIIEINLTDAGRARLRKAHAAALEVESAMLRGIGASDRRLLAGLLATCIANLGAPGEVETPTRS